MWTKRCIIGCTDHWTNSIEKEGDYIEICKHIETRMRIIFYSSSYMCITACVCLYLYICVLCACVWIKFNSNFLVFSSFKRDVCRETFSLAFETQECWRSLPHPNRYYLHVSLRNSWISEIMSMPASNHTLLHVIINLTLFCTFLTSFSIDHTRTKIGYKRRGTDKNGFGDL